VHDGPLVVNVARLRRSPGSELHQVRTAPVEAIAPLGAEGSTDPQRSGQIDQGIDRSRVESNVPPGSQVSCDVVLRSFEGGLMAVGTVRAQWRGLCRRCTAPTGGELHVAVRERFAPPVARRGLPEDDEAYPIFGDMLDLGPMVHDAVVLELPVAPLCRPDCRGLCPWCGIDRNVASCECVAPRDQRWANLDVLRPSR